MQPSCASVVVYVSNISDFLVTVPREHNHWVEQALSDLIEGAIAVVAQVR